MVLLDNKGQVLTEALCLGIEHSVLYYVETLAAAESRMAEGVNHAVD